MNQRETREGTEQQTQGLWSQRGWGRKGGSWELNFSKKYDSKGSKKENNTEVSKKEVAKGENKSGLVL